MTDKIEQIIEAVFEHITIIDTHDVNATIVIESEAEHDALRKKLKDILEED